MKVVDAGPLMNLGKLGLISLLRQLYEPVLVPSAVYHEVVTRGLELGHPDAYAVQTMVLRQELTVIEVKDSDLQQSIETLPLGNGEKHTIQLGVKEQTDYVLLDDLLAREIAQNLGLSVKGTMGVITDSYSRGLITKEELDLTFETILGRQDIWISDTLVGRVRAEIVKRQ